MFKRRSVLHLFGALYLLVAFTTANAVDTQTQPRTYVFECPDGFSFVARIEGETAWLFMPDVTRSLAHVPTGSGEKYSDGLTTFWNKDEQALLESNTQNHRGCRNDRARAIWEHAKLGGADFRATGNEPGWHLELSYGRRSVFVGDYGETRYAFTTPEPSTDRAARITRYEFQEDGHTWTIELEGRPCHDSMSGESFETTVKVTLDDRQYQGCGKALH